ncbi:MAG: hypothetical protein GC204_05870 [Chloroflexi bacterium]|nr:hypothetical protein [Chloroflexota bacterium]
MAKLLRFALGLSILLLALTGGALAAGQLQRAPRSIVRFHLSDCQPPCWIGIDPGLTTIAEAKTRLVSTFSGQNGLQVKDVGFADGNTLANAVENTIEGSDFSLYVRLDISPLVDGRTEIVQSIGLFEARPDRRSESPTVRDILTLFGAPQTFAEEETLGLGREITLRYAGMDVVYFTRVDRPPLDEIPRFYLGGSTSQVPATEFHPWKWISTFTHR